MAGMALGLLFIVAGVFHFLKAEFYVRIVPPQLPYPAFLVMFSGAAALLLGTSLLFRGTRRQAAWGAVAYLIAVFPANLYMALAPGAFSEIPAWVLWARLPLQAVLIAWAVFCARSTAASKAI